jgi:hypothetical protein
MLVDSLRKGFQSGASFRSVVKSYHFYKTSSDMAVYRMLTMVS